MLLQNFEIEEDGKNFKCRYCTKLFSSCAALGGHISKAHPGSSKTYNQKKKVRAQRELERRLHKESMFIYNEVYLGKSPDHKQLNRNTIRRLKKMLVTDKPEYQSLAVKYN